MRLSGQTQNTKTWTGLYVRCFFLRVNFLVSPASAVLKGVKGKPFLPSPVEGPQLMMSSIIEKHTPRNYMVDISC